VTASSYAFIHLGLEYLVFTPQMTLAVSTLLVLLTDMIPLCEIVRLCVDVGLREACEFYFQFKFQFEILL
jgi:hypothetical protein